MYYACCVASKSLNRFSGVIELEKNEERQIDDFEPKKCCGV